MSTYEKQPFHYKGGEFVEEILVEHRADVARPYSIPLGGMESLGLTTENAEALLMALFTSLYDHDGLSMDAAGRLHTMCLTVLQDPQEALEAAMMEAGEDF